MPATLTYPGVYIEEIPSGVRTITGVATSITAFIGRALRGPTDKAVTINSYGDFERIFGGLWAESSLGYAVRDFYLNGGSQAIIVRLFTPSFADDLAQETAFDAAQVTANTAAEAVRVAASDAATKTKTPEAAAAAATNAAKDVNPKDTIAKAAATAVAKAANDAVGKAASKASIDAAKDVAAKAQAAAAAVDPLKLEAKTAADAVAKAAVDAADLTEPPATTQTVVDAATAAVDTAIAAGPAVDPAKTEVKTAVDAVLKAAKDAVNTAKSNANIVAAAAVVAAAAGAVSAAANAAAAAAAPITRARISANELSLEAASEGSWGNSLRARIDHNVKDSDSSLFNLSIQDGKTGRLEVFRNVSIVAGHPRQVDEVLINESTLTRMTGSLPEALPSAHPLPKSNEDEWGDNAPSTNSKVEPLGQASDGNILDLSAFTGPGKQEGKQGLYALRQADLFNLLCIPPYLPSGDVHSGLIDEASQYCEKRRAMLLVDPPSKWIDKDSAKTGIETDVGSISKNAAIFFPRLRQPNPLRDNQVGDFVPCGAVAGVFARTDVQRGVWKAPAGLEATLAGVPQLAVSLTDAENGELNPLGVNCLRAMPAAGRLIWGSRTRVGDDRLASEWKYVPVRRTALFIEESLYRGTQWVVFEPNDEPLWAQIRLNLGAFMHNLFRQGAFQGKSPREAYFVKCDKETTTQNDINLGIVNIVVGFAPLKPAEFVIIKLQQMAGQIET